MSETGLSKTWLTGNNDIFYIEIKYSETVVYSFTISEVKHVKVIPNEVKVTHNEVKKWLSPAISWEIFDDFLNYFLIKMAYNEVKVTHNEVKVLSLIFDDFLNILY